MALFSCDTIICCSGYDNIALVFDSFNIVKARAIYFVSHIKPFINMFLGAVFHISGRAFTVKPNTFAHMKC